SWLLDSAGIAGSPDSLKLRQFRSGSVLFLGKRARQILPANELKALVAKKTLKRRAAHHIEISLSPGSAPIGMVRGSRAHLFVIISKVHAELVNARWERPQHLLVRIHPFFDSHSGLHPQPACDKAPALRKGRIRGRAKILARIQGWNLIGARHPRIDLLQVP